MNDDEIAIYLPTTFFELEDWKSALRLASETHRSVYTWKTVGRSNWLDRGLSLVDVLGLVLVPDGLPAQIDMPDDPDELGVPDDPDDPDMRDDPDEARCVQRGTHAV